MVACIRSHRDRGMGCFSQNVEKKEDLMSFNSFKFHPKIAASFRALGYITPTPIQVQAIPPVLEGQDVMGLAQTGTGKTAAFVLPILERLLPGPRGKVRSLIIAPTRELAEQTHVAIGEMGCKTHLRVAQFTVAWVSTSRFRSSALALISSWLVPVDCSIT